MAKFVGRENELIVLEASVEEGKALRDILCMSNNDIFSAREALYILNNRELLDEISNCDSAEMSEIIEKQKKIKRRAKIFVNVHLPEIHDTLIDKLNTDDLKSVEFDRDICILKPESHPALKLMWDLFKVS